MGITVRKWTSCGCRTFDGTVIAGYNPWSQNTMKQSFLPLKHPFRFQLCWWFPQSSSGRVMSQILGTIALDDIFNIITKKS